MKNLRHIIQESEKSKLQKDYEKYFQEKLDKYGVKSPADLSEEEKKKFFDEVQKGWTEGKGEKSTNESKEEEIRKKNVEDTTAMPYEESEDIESKIKKDGETAKAEIKEMEEDYDEEEIKESEFYQKLEEKISAAGIKRAKGLVPSKAVAALKSASFDIFDALREDGFDDEDIKDFINLYIDMHIRESLSMIKEEDSKLQKEYKEYFKAKLKDFGVGSPDELSEEDKKKFFDEVNKGWDNGKGEK